MMLNKPQVPFKTDLDERWARFFDRHGMNYCYDPDAITLGLTDYPKSRWDGRAIFWFPETRTLLEVFRDLEKNPGFRHSKNLKRLYNEFPICEWPTPSARIVIAGPGIGWEFRVASNYAVDRDSFRDWHFSAVEETHLVRCRECGRFYFIEDHGLFECPCCGNYDGPRSFEMMEHPKSCPVCKPGKEAPNGGQGFRGNR